MTSHLDTRLTRREYRWRPLDRYENGQATHGLTCFHRDCLFFQQTRSETTMTIRGCYNNMKVQHIGAFKRNLTAAEDLVCFFLLLKRSLIVVLNDVDVHSGCG